ncbi:hypothetical protein [Vibrio bivalvicida]|uniref:Uncharacterized protein n=1 Tax=Vibrio bivalvicida TaxID=1276888 RepID=A0A177XXZ1_9VIBR|nr:hypothetical protein [Vibrio bivalvicida]OAJ93458.1 hypothetical protein APB76_16015 [Vibrio bivalvicida]
MTYRHSIFLLSLLSPLIGCSSTNETLAPEDVVSQTPYTIEKEASDQEPMQKSIDAQVLLDTEPTRQILTAVESLTDTLNVLSFGIFAGSKM